MHIISQRGQQIICNLQIALFISINELFKTADWWKLSVLQTHVLPCQVVRNFSIIGCKRNLNNHHTHI